MLMGNSSQYHAIQQRKAILQHLNTQLKSLVKDEDFVIAAPFLFGPNFREIPKERLEAAALIQKTQHKAQPNFQKHHPRNRVTGVAGVAAREAVAPAGKETGRLRVQRQQLDLPSEKGRKIQQDAVRLFKSKERHG